MADWSMELGEQVSPEKVGRYGFLVEGGMIEIVVKAPNWIEYRERGEICGREAGLALDWVQATVEKIRNQK